jgi:hypothetical protein
MGETSRPVVDKANCAYLQCCVGLIRAGSMLDIASGERRHFPGACA